MLNTTYPCSILPPHCKHNPGEQVESSRVLHPTRMHADGDVVCTKIKAAGTARRFRQLDVVDNAQKRITVVECKKVAFAVNICPWKGELFYLVKASSVAMKLGHKEACSLSSSGTLRLQIYYSASYKGLQGKKMKGPMTSRDRSRIRSFVSG